MARDGDLILDSDLHMTLTRDTYSRRSTASS